MLKIYSKAQCTYCDQAKALLKSKNIEFDEVRIDLDPSAREFLISAGHKAVPQIYENSLYIGGFDALRQHLNT